MTTAELWCLKEETTIGDSKAAKEFADGADRHQRLILYQPPDNLLQEYSQKILEGAFDKLETEVLDQRMRDAGFHGRDFFLERSSRHWPSHFLIVPITRLAKLMANPKETF